MRWAIALVLAGCYRPASEHACTVTCGFDSDTQQPLCPAGLACRTADMLCTNPDGTCPAPPSEDARVDSSVQPVDIDATSDLCFGHQFQACLAALPTTELTLSTDVDTDSDGRCIHLLTSMNPSGICVIAGTKVDVTAPIKLSGTAPVVILATTSITIGAGASLDASASPANPFPAGAGPATLCSPGGLPRGDTSGDGGGGAGGSFAALGGDGGATMPAQAAAGMAGAPISPPTSPRGGCDGQPGAQTTGLQVPAAYGRGGGSIYLIAKGSILNEGIINASGQGAPGVMSRAVTGGGGGSGGMIGLDAPMIMLGGIIFANGGGGAGADSSVSASGASPSAGAFATPAAGGQPQTTQASGGTGGARTQNSGGAAPGVTSGPAGGGGGSVGYVFLYAETAPPSTGNVSPAPQVIVALP